MNIVRRDVQPLTTYRSGSAGSFDDQISRMVEGMFEDMFAPLVGFAPITRAQEGVLNPRLNLAEDDQAYQIEAEVPGVAKEEVKIAIDGRRVSIEAEHREEQRSGQGENVAVERAVRRYARSFTLPQEVDDEQAQAKLENGVLHLTLPKKPSSQGKQLAVS